MVPGDALDAAERRFAPDPSDTRALRDALGQFATGVAVVTARGARGPVGMTINSFASVSLDPPLVLWSAARRSERHEAFVGADHFVIHVLGAHQDELMARFTRGGAGFAGLPVRDSADGVPTIPGTLARFECVRHALHEAGDHTIVLGRVLRVARRDGEPLCFAQGRFGRFARLA